MHVIRFENSDRILDRGASAGNASETIRKKVLARVRYLLNERKYCFLSGQAGFLKDENRDPLPSYRKDSHATRRAEVLPESGVSTCYECSGFPSWRPDGSANITCSDVLECPDTLRWIAERMRTNDLTLPRLLDLWTDIAEDSLTTGERPMGRLVKWRESEGGHQSRDWSGLINGANKAAIVLVEKRNLALGNLRLKYGEGGMAGSVHFSNPYDTLFVDLRSITLDALPLIRLEPRNSGVAIFLILQNPRGAKWAYPSNPRR